MITRRSAAITGGVLAVFAVAGFIIGLVIATNLNITPRSNAQTDTGSVAVQLQNMFGQAASSAMPSVVNISAEKLITNMMPFGFRWRGPSDESFRFLPDTTRVPGLGSGVIVDSRGYILTNNHVVEGADKFVIILHDGTEFKGNKVRLVGTDPRTDLAVLKIEADRPLQAVKLGNSDAVKVGDWAIAIGNPFGFEGTVTVGVISAKGRSNIMVGEGASQQDYLQTDASINPGNSGGPLVNIAGEVIGINTAISSQTGFSAGVGFAIPVDLARTVFPQLIEKGKVERGWLGVYIQPINADMKEALGVDHGILINEIIPGGPAEQAGLKAQDVIVEFNGKPVGTIPDLQGKVAVFPLGKSAEVKAVRGGKERVFEVKISTMPTEVAENQPVKQEKQEAAAPWLGLEVEDSPDGQGVTVVGVKASSAAADAGIGEGDLISKVGQQDVSNMKDYDRAKKLLSGTNKPILFWIKSRASDRRMFVAVRPE
jgi:Do/DeqQ family serine protease